MDISEFLIHSPGYSLGERMFLSLESGDLSMSYLSKLMKRDFQKEDSAMKCLLSLRRRFWPI